MRWYLEAVRNGGGKIHWYFMESIERVFACLGSAIVCWTTTTMTMINEHFVEKGHVLKIGLQLFDYEIFYGEGICRTVLYNIRVRVRLFWSEMCCVATLVS